MDKDEQAPATPPTTPEVEKPEEPIVETPAAEEPAEAPATETPAVETPAAEPTATETPAVEGPAVETTPADNNVAAEMDKLLNDDAAQAAPAPEPQPMMGKSHNHVGIIIILSILVLLSVGFAIFEYITASNASCDCPKCEKTECNCEEGEEEEVSSEDYLYIGEWGIKIKIPEGLEEVGYHSGSIDNDLIYISGVKSGLSAEEKTAVEASGLLNGNLVGLSRVAAEAYKNDNCEASCPTPTYAADDYQYMYASPQTTTYESVADIEVSTVQLIVNMLKDTGNFSEI